MRWTVKVAGDEVFAKFSLEGGVAHNLPMLTYDRKLIFFPMCFYLLCSFLFSLKRRFRNIGWGCCIASLFSSFLFLQRPAKISSTSAPHNMRRVATFTSLRMIFITDTIRQRFSLITLMVPVECWYMQWERIIDLRGLAVRAGCQWSRDVVYDKLSQM